MRFTQKLTENRDFTRLYRRGQSLIDPLLITYIGRGRAEESCIGITCSKKIGKAVRRNRARRLIYAAYTVLEPRVKKGYRIVFVARAKTTFSRMGRVLQVMEKQLAEAGALVS